MILKKSVKLRQAIIKRSILLKWHTLDYWIKTTCGYCLCIQNPVNNIFMYLSSLSLLNLIYVTNNCCTSTHWSFGTQRVDIFSANPTYGTQLKYSNCELIALLTSPLPCYTLIVKKWVLLLSMAFGPERDARFFFYYK